VIKALRTPDPEGESGPLRTCIVTRTTQSPDGMIRFVLSPEGVVTPDLRRKLPGRGVWVTASRVVLSVAMKKQTFSKAFKTKALAPATLADDVEWLMERDALASLSLANKAGQVAAGATKIEAALAEGSVIAVIHAVEARDDGVRKLDAAMRRHTLDGEKQPVRIGVFATLQLDLALGRTNVIHAALKKGAASAAVIASSARLASFKGESAAQRQVEDETAEDPAATGMTDIDGLSPRTQD